MNYDSKIAFSIKECEECGEGMVVLDGDWPSCCRGWRECDECGPGCQGHEVLEIDDDSLPEDWR